LDGNYSEECFFEDISLDRKSFEQEILAILKAKQDRINPFKRVLNILESFEFNETGYFKAVDILTVGQIAHVFLALPETIQKMMFLINNKDLYFMKLLNKSVNCI
jgi:hypothetical protein